MTFILLTQSIHRHYRICLNLDQKMILPRGMIWVLSPRVEPTCAVIPARSKQQALDWSLVLVSQGIDCTIERAVEDGRWQLLVERNQCQQAIQALRQYKTENRTPSWRATV